MSITEGIYQPEIFNALKAQLNNRADAAADAFPETNVYGGGWHGGLSVIGVGVRLTLNTNFDNGTKIQILGDLDGVGLTACYGGGRIDMYRLPADLPSLKLWAEVFQTPGLPLVPPWLKVDFYLDREFVGRAFGPVIGVTTFAYARGHVICTKA